MKKFTKLIALVMFITMFAAVLVLPQAFAADTVVWYDGSIAGTFAVPQFETRTNMLTTRRIIVDCSKRTLDAGDGDIAQVIPIPAGTTVIAVWLRIITAETANGTVDLGVGGSNGWGDALAVDSAAGTILGAVNDWVPTYFATADTIDVTATTDTADVDIDGAKFEVVAVMLDTSNALY